MKSKHTPGPWKVQRHGQDVYDHDVEIWSQNTCIAFIDGAANARLIAAAPELLSLLQHLCSEITVVEREAILFEARAVIAKATGGES